MRTHRLIGDFKGPAWFYCIWVVVKKLWISASSNMIDAQLNAGISLANAAADLALLLFLWPFTARIANVTELIASIATIFCYTALGAPAMYPGQITLPNWCGDITIMSFSLVGVGMQAIRIMSGPSGKMVKMIFKGLQSFWKAVCGGAVDQVEGAATDARQQVEQSVNNFGQGSGLARQSSMVAKTNLQGVAEDLFDETYYPEDAVDDMMDEAEDALEAAEDAAEAAEDAADDSQVSRIIAVDIRETSTSIELMTVIWGLLSAGYAWHSGCWCGCGTGLKIDRGRARRTEERRRECMGKFSEVLDQKFGC